MLQAVKENLDRLIASGQQHLLRELGHGIEKEALRIDNAGQIALTDHPALLGSTLTHEQITTDYSEALMEFITGVSIDVRDCLKELTELHQFTYSMLGHESLWCASMPCAIKSVDDIRIAEYGSSNIGQLKYIYRVGLEHRYGKMMQTIAGIHYNFSISEAFWPVWKQACGSELSDKDFASDRYFALIRNFRRYSWLLLYLFGASPAVSKDFLQSVEHHLDPLDEDTFYLPYATSLRMSDLGYSNRAQEGLNVCFNHLETYSDSLQAAIQQPHQPYEAIGIKVDGRYRQLNSNVLQIENEYYSDIRPKRVAFSGEKPIHALMERGVQYIEVRNTDINPLLPVGIDLQQSLFMDAFLLTCLFAGEQLLTNTECSMVANNKDKVVSEGRRPGLMLETLTGEISREQFASDILDQVSLVAELLDEIHGGSAYQQAVQKQYELVANPQLTPSAKIISELKSSQLTFQEWTLKMGQIHRETLSREPLDPTIKQRLVEEAQHSLDKQRDAESQDEAPFDEFLQQYLCS